MTNKKEPDQLYKINEKGAGLDTTKLTYCPEEEMLSEFGYVYTKIGCCNDHIISGMFKGYPTKRLICGIDFVDNLEKSISTHLEALGKSYIDILELSSEVTWTPEIEEELNRLRNTGLVYDFSLRNPSLEKLKEVHESLKSNPSNELGIDYVSLDICPLNFNYDIVEYCKEEEIPIIGYNPMGGYLSSPSVIESFTIPYLLGFAATYCYIVMFSSRDLYKATQDAEYINKLEGTYSGSIYTLKKNVKKLQKPIKKVVYTSAIYDQDTHIPYNTPSFLPLELDSVILSLGKVHESSPKEKEELGEIEKIVESFIGELTFPTDAKKEDKFYLAQSQIIHFLKNKFKDFDFYCSLVNDTTVAIKAVKETEIGLFVKEILSETMSFIISMKNNGTIYFRGE